MCRVKVDSDEVDLEIKRAGVTVGQRDSRRYDLQKVNRNLLVLDATFAGEKKLGERDLKQTLTRISLHYNYFKKTLNLNS